MLIPGFGGFDALGAISYYNPKVVPIIRSADESTCVHFFPNLPSAAVATRARSLMGWLGRRFERGVFSPDDELHLVGHSTGGLDIRRLISIAICSPIADDECAFGNRLRGSLRSAQFISTPHRGTQLAAHFDHRWMPVRVAPRLGYEAARALTDVGMGLIGHAARLALRRRDTADWIDAAIDTATKVGPKRTALKRAEAVATYFELLRWLRQMADDTNSVSDLSPRHATVIGRVPDMEEEHRRHADACHSSGIRLRSIVTVAKPPANPWGVFGLLHGLTARGADTCRFPEMGEVAPLANGAAQTFAPAENDGIVNSLSMVWPEANRSQWVEADHADVIGHYRSCEPEGSHGRQYDLLASDSEFCDITFRRVWTSVAEFTARS